MARAHQDPVQPGIEPIGIAERREVAPGGDERLLGRVPRPVGIAEDQLGDAVEPGDRQARELVERVAVACHRSLDENPVHRTSLSSQS